MDRGICSWVMSIFTLKDDMILRKCGIDAIQYIRFVETQTPIITRNHLDFQVSTTPDRVCLHHHCHLFDHHPAHQLHHGEYPRSDYRAERVILTILTMTNQFQETALNLATQPFLISRELPTLYGFTLLLEFSLRPAVSSLSSDI